jgi:hypothetical protein
MPDYNIQLEGEGETKESSSKGCPTIDLPKGFAAPEDTQDGEEITVLCKIKPTGDGKAVITSVEGAPYEGHDEPKEEEGEMTEEMPESEKDTKVPTTEEGQNPMSIGDRIRELRTKMMK